MAKFSKVIPVHVNTEYSVFDVDFAVINLTASDIKRIKQLAKAVKDLKVTYIEEWDDTAELKSGEIDDLKDLSEDTRTECNMLKVSENDFHYNGLFRGTDVTWETEGIPLAELL